MLIRFPKFLLPQAEEFKEVITNIKKIKKIILPSINFFLPSARERAMLEIKTGDSDYMAIIGKTGQEIIEGKLHGDINVRPKFNEDELLRAKLIRIN